MVGRPIHDPKLDDAVWALAVLERHGLLTHGELDSKFDRIAAWRGVVKKTVYNRYKKVRDAPAPPILDEDSPPPDPDQLVANYRDAEELPGLKQEAGFYKAVGDEAADDRQREEADVRLRETLEKIAAIEARLGRK